MSAFLKFLDTYLQDHPLSEVFGFSAHASNTTASWLFLRALCREHGEKVSYRQRQLSLMSQDKDYPAKRMISTHLETPEGVCVTFQGLTSVQAINDKCYTRMLSNLNTIPSESLLKSQRYRLRIQGGSSEPDFIKEDKGVIPEELIEWKTSFEKAWFDHTFSDSSTVKSSLRL